MATWDNSQYDVNATEIAKTFCAGQGQNGSNLTDLVEKVARDNSLSGEQVKRLARTANVKTFGVKFEELKTAGAEDRNVEFQLADEAEVMRRLVGTASEIVKSAQVHTSGEKYPDLDDDYRSLRRPEYYEEKTASVHLDLPRERADREIMKLERLRDETDILAKQAANEWHYSLEDILAMTRKSNWTPSKTANLERTSLALYGVRALPEINTLRKLAKQELLTEVTIQKLAAFQDHFVINEGNATAALKTAMDSRLAWEELDKARDLIDSKLVHWNQKLAETYKKKTPENEKRVPKPLDSHTMGKAFGTAAMAMTPGVNMAVVPMMLAGENPAMTQFFEGAGEAVAPVVRAGKAFARGASKE